MSLPPDLHPGEVPTEQSGVMAKETATRGASQIGGDIDCVKNNSNVGIVDIGE